MYSTYIERIEECTVHTVHRGDRGVYSTYIEGIEECTVHT